MPTHKDIAIWRGNTETIPVEVKARVGSVIEAVNLTGSTLHFRAEWAGGVLSKDIDITDASLGLAELRLTAAETRGIPQGSAALYEHASGERDRRGRGKWIGRCHRRWCSRRNRSRPRHLGGIRLPGLDWYPACAAGGDP